MSKRSKLLIALGIVVGLIVVGMVLLVVFFPADFVRDRAVAAMESNLQRPVHVGDVGVSLFPSLGANLTDVRIGDRAEPGRPRIALESIKMSVRLLPLLRRKVEIKSVEIEGLDVQVRLGEAEAAAAGGEAEGGREPGEADATGASGAVLYFVVQNLKLKDGRITVQTEDGAPLIRLGGISEELSADATSAGDLRLAGETVIDSIRVHLPSGDLGRGMSLRLVKSLHYDSASDSLLVEKADLDLSGLPVSLTGAAGGVTSKSPGIDVKFEGGPAEVSDVLGYLPAGMFPQMEGIESKGTVALRGTVRGPLGSEAGGARGDDLDYRLTLTLSEGRIVHPKLPEPIERVGFSARLTPHTIDVSDLAMQSGGSSVKARAKVSEYKTAPEIDADLDADVDLQTYSAMLPEQDGMQMSGRTAAKLKVRGPVADVNELDVAGTVDLSSVRVAFPDGGPPLEGVSGRVSIRDKGLTLQGLSGKYGSTDFSAKGTLSNYPALMPESAAKGPARIDLDVSSKLLALDELQSQGEAKESEGEKPGEGPTSAEKTAALLASLTGAIEVSADRVRTKEVETGPARGLVKVDRGLINIERLGVEVFQGKAAVQGTVDYRDPRDAKMDLGLKIEGARVSDLLTSSKSINSFSKMGGFLTGQINANATFAGDLKEAQGLDLRTVSSIGDLSIDGAELVNHPLQLRLADYFEAPELKKVVISQWFQPFRIEDGRLYVEGLSIKSQQVELTASGWQSLDGKVDMSLEILLPRGLSEGLRKHVPGELVPVLFGGDGTQILAPVKLTGSYDSPSVKLDTDRLALEAQAQAKKRLAEERKGLEEQVKDKARGFLDGLLKPKPDTTSKK